MGSRVLLANAVAALYTDREGNLTGCATAGDAAAERVYLASEGEFYGPPIMALSGSGGAVAVNKQDDGIQVTSFALGRFGPYRLETASRPVERVGSLRVRPNGTVAWISCALPDAEDYEVGVSPRPDCVQPRRARNSVLLLRPSPTGRHPRIDRLDHAGNLDPRSLRMSASSVSWVRDHKRIRFDYRALTGASRSGCASAPPGGSDDPTANALTAPLDHVAHRRALLC